MTHRRPFLQSLLAAAGAALWLTSYPHYCVAVREPTEVPKTDVGPQDGALQSRTSLQAPRGAEGIRRRLAAGRGTVLSEQTGSNVAVNRDHTATATCKRRGWEGDGITHADVCHVGEGSSGLDFHQSAGQGSARNEEGQGSKATLEGRTEAPSVAEDDFSGPRHALFRERAQSKASKDSPSPDGIADSIRTPVIPGVRGGGPLFEPGKTNSTHLQVAPGLEHDPWEGYRIIAHADAVASWEILREVRFML